MNVDRTSTRGVSHGVQQLVSPMHVVDAGAEDYGAIERDSFVDCG